MRKTFLLFVMSAATLGTALSQDEATMSTSSGFKPSAGDKTLEVQFAPLGGNPISIGGIRARKFTSATSALRLNVFLGYNTSSEITQQEDGDADLKELKDVTSSFTFDIRPGIESHFGGSEKLSPFIGAELVLGFRSSTTKSDYQDADDNVQTDKIINENSGDGYLQLGLNGLAGVDFYFAKNLYLGTEIGFGLLWAKDGTQKVKPAEGDAPDDVKRGSSFDLGPVFTSQIRLGWVF